MKWPGGKSRELSAIAAAAPLISGRLIDPFVGGGAVLLATPTVVPAWANDACEDLVCLYRGIAGRDAGLTRALTGVGLAWDRIAGLDGLADDLVDAFVRVQDRTVHEILGRHASRLEVLVGAAGAGLLPVFIACAARDMQVKFGRMRAIESKMGRRLSPEDVLTNMEGAVRAAFYMAIRARYNKARLAGRWDASRAADFMFLREFAYAAMFRFNARGEFNVPYGGISYNHKSFAHKLPVLGSGELVGRLATTTWRATDFEPFLEEAGPGPDDLLFIDPPYDGAFSAYDNRPFGPVDHRRLNSVLARTTARVLMVVQDTPFIRALYVPDRWRIAEHDKTYAWTIKGRNDRRARHLVIANH